jgi:Flp pilus assembly protein TadD
MAWRSWRAILVWGLALMSAQAALADELRPPQNVNVEPTTPRAAELSTRAAIAAMNGNPTQARDLANQAIRANPRDPWPHYSKGMALAQLGETDAALAALFAAEQRFAAGNRWGRSIAIYGRAHALSQAGRCVEAVQAYAEYARFVGKDDPQSAEMARRYAVNCRTPAAASAAPSAPAPGPAPAAPAPAPPPPAPSAPTPAQPAPAQPAAPATEPQR